MFIFESMALSVLTSLLTSGAKTYISNILQADDKLEQLLKILEDKTRELNDTLQGIDAKGEYLRHSSIPSDWLDELEQCRYEVEDIEDSMDPARKKDIVQKFLETNIKHVTEMQAKLRKREKHMVPRRQKSLEHASIADESLWVEEKKKIVEELKKKSDSSGVSIIGIGGIGKTKLAEAIADEASIKAHFPCRLFPPTSPEFNSRSVLEDINSKLPSADQRVLIILDDIHSLTPDGWNQFRSKYKKVLNPESKVLITTQNPRVADVTGTSKHCLDSLSNADCFLLIKNCANANRNLSKADVYSIEQNEEELIGTCKGLPLLANQIGLLLSAAAAGKRVNAINKIKSESLWKEPDLERVLLGLKPVSLLVEEPHLKRCLAYCYLFPQDYDFTKENLVEFWMAEVFTQPSEDANYLLNTTRKHFDDLLSHSLFQKSESQSAEEPSYKMHEMAYDLAQHVASKTVCQVHIKNSISFPPSNEISNFTRHVSLISEGAGYDEKTVPNLLEYIQNKCRSLRTFILVNEAGKKISKNPTFFQSLTRLRVLDLSHTNLTKLETKNIFVCLRYLDLSHTPIKRLSKLPKSPALQVLKLNNCSHLLSLPKDLTRSTNLVSLQLDNTSLGSMPPSIGNLRNLQKLNIFIVGSEDGFKIAELQNLNKLRKSLHITQLENVQTCEEAEEAKLLNKINLKRLELEWSRSTSEAAKQVLEGLRPPKNLKELIIRNYCGSEYPQWLNQTKVCMLLETIHLDRCKVLPSLDKLEMLETLRVEAMHDIKHVGHGISSKNGTIGQPLRFKYIVSLILCDMPELSQWIELAASDMPNLCSLQVDKCPTLLNLPSMEHLKLLKKLQISRCTMLQDLPCLPASLEILIIRQSYILKQKFQEGQAYQPKIRDIKVEIDPVSIDTSEQHPSAPDEIHVQGTSGDQETSQNIQSSATNHISEENNVSKGRTLSSGGFSFSAFSWPWKK